MNNLSSSSAKRQETNAVLAKKHEKIHAENAEILSNPLAKGMKTEMVLFACWLAFPRATRAANMKTQKQFSAFWNVDITTLSRWKKKAKFQVLRLDLQKDTFREETVEILNSLKNAALSPIAVASPVPAIKLWLQYIEDWKEGQTIDTTAPDQIVFVNVPRSQFLEEPKKH